MIRKLEYIGGKTNIARALTVTRDVVFNRDNGDRLGVNNLAILVTDGMDNIDDLSAVGAAQELKRTGAQVRGGGGG